MGWLSINTQIDGRLGYLRGVGADDGLYCYFAPLLDKWIVSRRFAPRIMTNLGRVLRQMEYTYNGQPVYMAEHAEGSEDFYIFNSFSRGWIGFERLAEPVSYYDVTYGDDSQSSGAEAPALLGDTWMALENPPPTDPADYSGVIATTCEGCLDIQWYRDGISYEMAAWYFRGSPLYMPYGPYLREADGSVIVVGNPVWNIETASRESGLRGATVRRSALPNGEIVYPVSARGLVIHRDRTTGQWVAGEPGVSEVWWIGSGPPNYTRYFDTEETVSYEAYANENTRVRDYDFQVRFWKCEEGEARRKIYVGEIAQWT